MSSVTTSVSGATVARTKSGPISNSGFGREPPEPPTPVGNHPPSAVDQGSAPRRAEPLAFLGIGPAEIEDLRLRRLPGRDARERLSGNDGPRLALGRRAA